MKLERDISNALQFLTYKELQLMSILYGLVFVAYLFVKVSDGRANLRSCPDSRPTTRILSEAERQQMGSMIWDGWLWRLVSDVPILPWIDT